MSISISQPHPPDSSLALYKTLHEIKTEVFGTVRLNRIDSPKKWKEGQNVAQFTGNLLYEKREINMIIVVSIMMTGFALKKSITPSMNQL